MGIGDDALSVGKTAGVAVVSKMLGAKVWTLENLLTRKTIKGQFPAEEVTRNVGANWTEINALNRQTAFLQFLNGKTETLEVSSTFYKRDLLDESPVDRIELLTTWTMMDPKLRRPALLVFTLGDGLGLQKDVLLTDVADIKYGTPNGLGGIRKVTFTMKFKAASRSLLMASDTGKADDEVTDTRYATAQEGQYYEQLALIEYGDPMFGVIIRQRHPDKPLLNIGDRVALSALEGIRSEIPAAISIQLKGAFGRKDTATKRRRIQAFTDRSTARQLTNFTLPSKPALASFTSSGIFDFTFDATFE